MKKLLYTSLKFVSYNFSDIQLYRILPISVDRYDRLPLEKLNLN